MRTAKGLAKAGGGWNDGMASNLKVVRICGERIKKGPKVEQRVRVCIYVQILVSLFCRASKINRDASSINQREKLLVSVRIPDFFHLEL